MGVTLALTEGSEENFEQKVAKVAKIWVKIGGPKLAADLWAVTCSSGRDLCTCTGGTAMSQCPSAAGH